MWSGRGQGSAANRVSLDIEYSYIYQILDCNPHDTFRI